MKYAGIIYNDFAAAPGVSLTVFTQGCNKRCKGCHNPETWDFEGGKEYTSETTDRILNGLHANGINRNLCIMGGEPLHSNNLLITLAIILNVKAKYPDTKIYLWTGYVYEDIKEDPRLKSILDNIDVLIDGPYIEEQRDITLQMRGSRNQRIIDLKNNI